MRIACLQRYSHNRLKANYIFSEKKEVVTTFSNNRIESAESITVENNQSMEYQVVISIEIFIDLFLLLLVS